MRTPAERRLQRIRISMKKPHPTAKRLWEHWTDGAVFGSVLMLAAHAPPAHPVLMLVATVVCTLLLAVFLPPELWAAIWAPDWTYSWTVSEWEFGYRWGAAVVLPVVGARTIALWPIPWTWWNHVLHNVGSGPFAGANVAVGDMVAITVWFVLAGWLVAHFLSKMRLV